MTGSYGSIATLKSFSDLESFKISKFKGSILDDEAPPGGDVVIFSV
jgi:hypothetical protein